MMTFVPRTYSEAQEQGYRECIIGPWQYPYGVRESRGEYMGSAQNLKGCTCIMGYCIDPEGWIVQVDQWSSGNALGWWWFPLSDWMDITER